MSVGLDGNSMGPKSKRQSSQRGAGDKDSYANSLIEQLGSPEMLLKELKSVKRDNETLKNQLEVKEKSVANYRSECTKMRKENYDLKRQIIVLKEQLSNRPAAANNDAARVGGGQAAAQEDNDLGAARALAEFARPRAIRRPAGGNALEEFDAMAQI